MITMKHKLAYIDAKALRYRAKHDDPFPFYRNFDDAYQICIRSRCPVDRVFRNSEVLLYRHYFDPNNHILCFNKNYTQFQ